jgi:aprataxin
VIHDAYPKARIHLLVLPKEGLLGDAIEVRQLRPEHLDNLKQVHAVARDIAVKLQSTSKHPILLGYHAVPSLHPLHIHIISSDFDSPALKTKKHWNSFTLSEHFIGVDRVEEWLAQGHSVDEQLLPEAELHDLVATTSLKCNQCQTSMSNMPNLKKHMATHL